MGKWGIQEDDVASHHLKTMGSITRKMTPEEREIFQALVNEGFTQFKNVIKQGRPKFQKDPAALDKLATGQVFTAQQALEQRTDRQDRVHRRRRRSGDPSGQTGQRQRQSGEVQGRVAAFGHPFRPEPRAAVVRFGRAVGWRHAPRLLPLHLDSGGGRQRQRDWG